LIGNPALNPRTEQSEVGEETLQLVRTQQEVSGASWDAKQYKDRGNQAVIYQGSVKREFTGLWEAMDFVASLAWLNVANQAHSWAGDVWLREDKPDGSYKEWQLPSAVVAVAGLVRTGVSVNFTYRISAGGFGLTRTGTSVPVNLVGYGDPGLALSFTVEDMDDLMFSFEIGTTDYFQLTLARVATGGGSFAANYRFHPGGADGGGTSVNFNYPFSDALVRFMSRVNTQFSGYLTVSVTDGVMTFSESTPGVVSEFSLTVSHRYDSTTDEIATFEAEPTPGLAFSLTGVDDGTTYSLTGIES
jgi:hypothetical protein